MKKRTTVLILALLVLLVCAAGVIAWMVTHPPAPLVLEPNVVALTPTPQGETAPKDGIQIPGYPTLSADSATGAINTVFQNPEGNRCYFELTLTRSDTGEELWRSAKFKPGTGIQNPVLTTTLPPGTYPAVLTYTTTSLKDQSPMNGAVINTQLVVH